MDTRLIIFVMMLTTIFLFTSDYLKEPLVFKYFIIILITMIVVGTIITAIYDKKMKLSNKEKIK